MSKVYKEFRQFGDNEILKETIELAYDSIDGELLLKFAKSIQKRWTEVIENEVDRKLY